MDKQVQGFEALLESEYGNIAGLVVWRDGKTQYENYFNGCTATSPVHVFSVTKSIVSILVGIAIEKGFIDGTEQRILDFFPGYTLKRGEKTIQKVTLENMLTMTAPYKYKSAPYTKYFTSEDWVKSALDLLGGKGPIGEFRYTPLIGPDILSGILAAATSQPVRSFAQEHLFSPLGISVGGNVVFQDKEAQFAFLRAKGISGWVADPKGVNTAGWGLTLTAMDMAKIGQLYLEKGKWEGQQIVSPEWIETSTQQHSRWEELDLAYGYLWWINENGYAAMGDSGNIIYVNTELKLVVSIASLYKPSAKDRIGLIQEHIEPLFASQL